MSTMTLQGHSFYYIFGGNNNSAVVHFNLSTTFNLTFHLFIRLLYDFKQYNILSAQRGLNPLSVAAITK